MLQQKLEVMKLVKVNNQNVLNSLGGKVAGVPL